MWLSEVEIKWNGSVSMKHWRLHRMLLIRAKLMLLLILCHVGWLPAKKLVAGILSTNLLCVCSISYLVIKIWKCYVEFKMVGWRRKIGCLQTFVTRCTSGPEEFWWHVIFRLSKFWCCGESHTTYSGTRYCILIYISCYRNWHWTGLGT